MTRTAVLAAGLLTLAALTAGADARAGGFFHRHRGTPPPGARRVFENTQARAGDPLVVSPHASPTRTPAYAGYYVGGGSSFGGESRRREEGTWGWDYVGTRLPRNVALRWSHGGRYQGGTGSYRTDVVRSADSIGFVINGLRGRAEEAPEP